MVGPARCRVDQATSDSGDKESIVDLHLNSVVDAALTRFRKHGIQALSLRDSAGKAIKDEADEFNEGGLAGDKARKET